MMIDKLDLLEPVESKKKRLEIKVEEYENKKCLIDDLDY